MAKILVEDLNENTRVPLLRGILVHSLQGAGLSFDSAFQLATDIRAELKGTAIISTKDLRQMVLELLKNRIGQEAATRYEKQKEDFIILVEQRDGQPTPFSRLEYQHGLEIIGLSTSEAMDIVSTVYKHLIDRRVELITSKHLGELTYRYLRQSSQLGANVAHRWLVWRDFIHSGRPLIFLIGGTAACGKSTIATLLANRLDIVSSQSTDMLREVMRIMMPTQLLPVLHTSSFAAWTALPGSPDNNKEVPEALLQSGYRSQADLLSIAIEAVIKRALNERVSLVMEGVHIQPNAVESLLEVDAAVVVPIMLGVLKRKELERRIIGRGTAVPQRRSARYMEHFDEIWQLQSYLLSEADSANIPIVVNDDRERVFREIMRITIATLAKDFNNTSQAVFQ